MNHKKSNHFVNDGDFQIIDEIQILKNNFKNNKVNYTYNDITFELYNHNGKYYFFHFSIFEKILKTKKNPYNNQILTSNIIKRIFLKKKLNDIIMFLILRKDEYDINNLYKNFKDCNQYIRNKYIFEFIKYFNENNVNLNYINENFILQIITNLGFTLNINDFDSSISYALLGYLFSKYF